MKRKKEIAAWHQNINTMYVVTMLALAICLARYDSYIIWRNIYVALVIVAPIKAAWL